MLPDSEPEDVRTWRLCDRGNIAVLSPALVQRYDSGLPEIPNTLLKSCITALDSTNSDVHDDSYCLEEYTPQEAFDRIQNAFGSIGGLASSFLVDGWAPLFPNLFIFPFCTKLRI